MDLHLSFLEKSLRARVEILNVHGQSFPAGSAIADSIVPTSRLLLVERGAARYTIENRTFRFSRGMMLLISARTRRAWAVGRGSAFRLWWIEFQTPAVPPFSHLLLPGCELPCELSSYRRLACLQNLRGRRHELQAEGEFKALLARFLASVSPGRAVSRGQSRRTSGDQAIVKAVEWLGANYAQPGALDDLPERVGLSPNHFRLLFKRHCGVSAQAYLTAQRMRAARAMLQETARAVKDIAHALGYSDALFFSRHYRAFWKRTPTEDRSFNP